MKLKLGTKFTLPYNGDKIFEITEVNEEKQKYFLNGDKVVHIRFDQEHHATIISTHTEIKQESTQCTCEYMALMRNGCKCGAIKPYVFHY